jgi:hypothetical protein
VSRVDVDQVEPGAALALDREQLAVAAMELEQLAGELEAQAVTANLLQELATVVAAKVATPAELQALADEHRKVAEMARRRAAACHAGAAALLAAEHGPHDQADDGG